MRNPGRQALTDVPHLTALEQHMPDRGVLWDMDGVLVDTGEFHFQSWAHIFQELGIPFSRQQFRATFGMNNAGMLQAILEGPLEPEVISMLSERKEGLFRQAIHGKACLLPGARDWLDRLRGWGVRQAVASSAPPANIDTLADELGIRSYFRVMISGQDMPGKPDPDVFLHTAQAIGLPPTACVVIEDSIAGVEAARRAEMKCIAVTTTNPPEALGAASLVVDSLADLPVETFRYLWG